MPGIRFTEAPRRAERGAGYRLCMCRLSQWAHLVSSTLKENARHREIVGGRSATWRPAGRTRTERAAAAHTLPETSASESGRAAHAHTRPVVSTALKCPGCTGTHGTKRSGSTMDAGVDALRIATLTRSQGRGSRQAQPPRTTGHIFRPDAKREDRTF